MDDSLDEDVKSRFNGPQLHNPSVDTFPNESKQSNRKDNSIKEQINSARDERERSQPTTMLKQESRDRGTAESGQYDYGSFADVRQQSHGIAH